MIPNIHQDVIRFKDIHTQAGVIFLDNEIINQKLYDLLENGYFTPRRLDRTLPKLAGEIRMHEKQGRDNIIIIQKKKELLETLFPLPQDLTSLSVGPCTITENEDHIVIIPTLVPLKSETLAPYKEQLLSILPDHANTTGHTKKLISYLEQYPYTNDVIKTNNTRLGFLIHDLLGETRLWDVTQREGKTDNFRLKEDYASRHMFDTLYQQLTLGYDHIKKIHIDIHNKNSALYITLKVYEAFSVIDALLELDQGGFIKTGQEPFSKIIQNNIEHLHSKLSQYPCIQGFLDERKYQIDYFIKKYTIVDLQGDLFK